MTGLIAFTSVCCALIWAVVIGDIFGWWSLYALVGGAAAKEPSEAQRMSQAERIPVLIVRLRPGVVGESRRSCHFVEMPYTEVMLASLLTCCGLSIEPGTADLLATAEGMPCEPCLLHVSSNRVTPQR